MAGTLFVVATPIGNLEDITARALRILREVALIAAEDTRRTGHLLARYGISTRTTSLHRHNEHHKLEDLLARLREGESIALVSDAGTPSISDPGGEFVAAAIRAAIRVEPIPGPSAVVAALSVSGFECSPFTFLGFAPTKGADRRAWMERARQSAPCVIFYEAPHRIRFTLEEFRRNVGDVDVLVARELTKVHEELLRGTISSVLEQLGKPIGEFTIVAKIGQSTDEEQPSDASPGAIFDKFCLLTESDGLTRRQAIARLSREFGTTAKVIYAAIEVAKKSVS